MPADLGIDELLRNVRNLATFPPVLAKLNVAVNSNKSLETVAEIIAGDTDLSARLLKLVNSSFYGLSRQVGTLSQAVSLIGIQEVRQLALATNAISLFPGISVTLVNMESFWRHSIGCAVTAKVLAEKGNPDNRESIFIAGLLHDIGKLVIYLCLPDQSRQILDEAYRSQKLQHLVERDMLGYDHAEVGGQLLTDWSLPEYLTHAVAHHHKPVGNGYVIDQSTVVYLADLLAHSMDFGDSGNAYYTEPSGDDWTAAGLEISDEGMIRQTVRHEFDAAVSIFSDLI